MKMIFKLKIKNRIKFMISFKINSLMKTKTSMIFKDYRVMMNKVKNIKILKKKKSKQVNMFIFLNRILKKQAKIKASLLISK